MNKNRECEYLEEYVSLLEGELDACEDEICGEAEQAMDAGAKYKQQITREAEWKLRKKQERKPKSTTAPKPPKPRSTLPRPKADHGTAPTAPDGQEYFWAEPKAPKSGKGGL
jgi:hypothetical protein